MNNLPPGVTQEQLDSRYEWPDDNTMPTKKKVVSKVPVIVKKTITIQPKQRPDGRLPYPFHISETGRVGRQDFWKGSPLKLIGFNPKPNNETVKETITVWAFLKKPKSAIGMYPIFAHKNGEWYTYQDPIESISITK